ncbi:MAG: hypothetical protein WAU21_14680 [Chitinophagales bacterium]|nr:hypothetical protein [Bacteroidota bacterium]MBK8682247.1 hypothetical protein [Bacteroidota bacterium]
MKRREQFLFGVILFLIVQSGTAQIITTYEEDGSVGTVIDRFDQTPEYAGPDLLLFNYFENNVFANMPAQSQDETSLGADGSLYNEYVIVMRFTLDSSGIPTNREIISSDNLMMNDAFQKALIRMPGWYPAIIDGEYTTVVVTLPIRYVIDGRFIQIKGYDTWMYKSTGANFWLKLAIGIVAVGAIALLFLNK